MDRKNGTKIFENDFIPVLEKELGIKAESVEIMLRSCSCFADGNKIVPYLSIRVIGEIYYDLVTSPNQGLAKEEYFLKIRTLWREYVEAKGYDKNDYYDSKLYIGISSYDNKCFEDFAKNQKDAVERYLVNAYGVSPRKVYSSSMPGLIIVYETADYERLGLQEKTPAIQNAIIGLAKEYVTQKYGSLMCRLNVTVKHPDMTDYNGYFLSRED